MTDLVKPSCGRCAYDVPDSMTEDYGACHRFPPVTVGESLAPHDPSRRPLYLWPSVHVSDWCGEFKARKEDSL